MSAMCAYVMIFEEMSIAPVRSQLNTRIKSSLHG